MNNLEAKEGDTMTIREDVPPGAPCWVDLMSSDIDKSIEFYGSLFGWTAESTGPDFGGYVNFSLRGEMVAGLMQAQPGGMPDVWSVYLTVPDAAAAVGATKENGGEVHVDAMPVGDLGVMAMVGDPTGAAIGMWQPGQHRGGVVATSGAPCHWELHTRDYDTALRFYEKVFGWANVDRSNESPDFRYAVLSVGDGENAGVMDASAFLPEGVPSHWSVYFAVDDVDSTLAEVERLGGKTVMPAETTPYGRLAVASDATGATFKLRAD
jgi:uncharacterized protein